MRTRTIRALFLTVATMLLATASFAQVSVSISTPPPELPAYEQPACPGDGYLWTPGYWAWNEGDYYWVPGTWVQPPEAGYLWTPGYWGWNDNSYVFYDGYWDTSVGFYGGIDYGYGYFGNGFEGGRWDHGRFAYNTAVNNVDVHRVHNVYRTSVNAVAVNHVSFNGGSGGISARADAQQEAMARRTHIGSAFSQPQHAWAARNNPDQRFSTNRGRPAIAATARPSVAVHPRDLPPIEHLPAPNTGDTKRDQEYQKAQETLVARQSQDRQALQQRQDAEHQRLTTRNANAARTQQLDQRHMQQTQRLQQGHVQQLHQMQARQQRAGGGAQRGNRR